MTILVTGATGSVGRRVVDQLLAAGADDVRALTTDPQKAVLPPAVDVVEGYIGRPESLPRALTGVDRMYLAPAPQTVAEVAPLLARAGVRHIVDLSGPADSWWHAVAEAVEQSGATWTHLWPGEFMENSTAWAEQIRRTGVVRDAYPDAANAPIAMEDVAAIAAASLLGEGHEGESYLLTGPETLSRRELVERIATALGREVPFIEVSRDEAIKQLTPVMGEYAAWYVDGAADLVVAPQPVAPTFEEVSGHPGTTFSEWARANAHEFR